MTTYAWPIDPWSLIMTPEPRRILAWEVRPEGHADTAVWSVECIAKAFDAGHKLELLTQVLDRDTGGYLYETFKKKGCAHCKRWAQLAVVWRVEPCWLGGYRLEDGAGHQVAGIRGLDVRQAPIRIPKDFDSLTDAEAQQIKQVLIAGLAQPVFK